MRSFYRVVLPALLLLMPAIRAAAEESPLVQQIFVYSEGKTDRFVYYYKGGLKVLELHQTGSDEGWANVGRTEWTYNADHLCTRQTVSSYSSDKQDWTLESSVETEYDHDAATTVTTSTYTDGNLTAQVRTTFEVDGIGRIEEETYQLRNLGQDTWTETGRKHIYYNAQTNLTDSMLLQGTDTSVVVYTYDNQGNPTEQVIRLLKAGRWTNNISYSARYEAGLLTQQTIRLWSLTDAGYRWVNSQRRDYTYLDNGLTESETELLWNSTFWENQNRYTYQYDSDGRLVSRQQSALVYRQWRATQHIGYSYQTSPRMETAESTYDYWGGEEGEASNTLIPVVFNDDPALVSKQGEKVEVVYTIPDPTTTLLETNHRLCYPNPSDGIFYVDSKGLDILSWKLYDLSGRMIMQYANSSATCVVDITRCGSGIYHLELQTNGGTYHSRLIKK